MGERAFQQSFSDQTTGVSCSSCVRKELCHLDKPCTANLQAVDSVGILEFLYFCNSNFVGRLLLAGFCPKISWRIWPGIVHKFSVGFYILPFCVQRSGLPPTMSRFALRSIFVTHHPPPRVVAGLARRPPEPPLFSPEISLVGVGGVSKVQQYRVQ